MKKKKQAYERLGTVSIEEVMKMKGEQTAIFLDQEVRLNASKRIETFIHKGTTCSNCGREASFFAIERHLIRDPNNKSGKYHLNLYGLDEQGNEIMFTHDHTMARALGGNDDLSNMTTMCSPCNSTKSINERKAVEEIRKS